MVVRKEISTKTVLHRLGNMETGTKCQLLVLLAVAASHVALAIESGEDVCKTESVFERLVELEYKVRKMDMEMVKTNAGWLGLLDTLNRKIDEMSPQEGVKRAAFSAYNPVSKLPKTGDVIVFGNTQVNERDAYSDKTGEFTVPDGGLYEFNAHICNSGGKFIVYSISRNGNESLAVSTQWDDSDSCGSVNALAYLNVGDKVFLKCDYCDKGVQFYENVHRRNTFSGVWLH